MFFRHNAGGSSSAYNYSVVWLIKLSSERPESPVLREIPIEYPVTALSSGILKKDQSSPLYRTHIERSGSEIKFSFCIWNQGDLSNFPTGGSVVGNLKLVLDKNGNPVRFVTDQWRREAP